LIANASKSITFQSDDELQDFLLCDPLSTVRLNWNGSGETRTQDLRRTQFYSSPGPCGPENEEPVGIKSAVVYDRGECSRLQVLAPELRAATRSTWNQVFEAIWDNGFVGVDAIDRNVFQVIS